MTDHMFHIPVLTAGQQVYMEDGPYELACPRCWTRDGDWAGGEGIIVDGPTTFTFHHDKCGASWQSADGWYIVAMSRGVFRAAPWSRLSPIVGEESNT